MELRSPQCTVRRYRPADAARLAHHGTNRKVWLNLRDRFPHPFLESEGAEYIARVLKNPHQTSFAIDVDGAAIGGISLHVGTDIERLGAELGYWIGEEYWGRGIATSAIQLVTAYAFAELGLVRVFAVPFCEQRRIVPSAGEGGIRARGDAAAERDQGWSHSRSVPVRDSA